MNGTEIDRVLRRNCPIYRGVYGADELPNFAHNLRPMVIVANTDPMDLPGTHWVCLYFHADNIGEYFDSFGSRATRGFANYMNSNCNSWTHNDRQLQSIISRYCGAYCVWFCVMKSRGYSMNNIVRSLTNDTALNDHLVHKFSCRMLKF